MWEFHLHNIEDLRRLGSDLETPVDAIEDVSILAEPVRIRRIDFAEFARYPPDGRL